MFPAPMWDKLVATPYGRYNSPGHELTPADCQVIEEGVRGQVKRLGWDEYEGPVGGPAAYKQHFGRTGVKIVGGGKRRGVEWNILNNL